MNWQILVGIFFLIGGIGNLTKDFGAFLFGIAVGAVLLYWGLMKKGILKKSLPTPQIADRSLKVEIFHLTGVSYYTENVGKLAVSNPDWKATSKQLINSGKVNKKVFRYSYVNKPVKLIPEPENPHDSNAIMVQIAGEKVGYINREENLHVLEILNHHEIKHISSFIGGGQYKMVLETSEMIHDELAFTINVKISYV